MMEKLVLMLAEAPVFHINAGEIPKGALYVGTDARTEGNVTHLDTFYLIPTADNGQTDGHINAEGHLITEKIKDERDYGVQQPTTSEPELALPNEETSANESRTEQADNTNHEKQPQKKPKSWYTEMYTQARKSAQPKTSELNTAEEYTPTYVFPEKTSTEKSPEENTYQPTYQFPESDREETTPQRDKSPEITEHVVKTVTRVTERASGVEMGSHVVEQRHFKSKPSVRIRPAVPNYQQLHIDTDTRPQPPFSSHEQPNPFMREQANNSVETEDQASPLSPKLQYREIQRGGEIPIEGLRKPAPIVPEHHEEAHYVPEPVVGYNREPEPLTREQRDELDAKRRHLMRKVEYEEKRKKAQQEQEQRKARRHSDCFTSKDKSPIPGNRYDVATPFNFSPAHTRSAVNSPSPYADIKSPLQSPRAQSASPSTRQNKPIAKLLYKFPARNPREIGCDKGELVTIQKQIDRNWYEVTKDGRTGILPINYVQMIRDVNTPPPQRSSMPVRIEGSAVAKYNFVPQSQLELPLHKGDIISVLRKVDKNWFEGRINNRYGIFPASYVQIIAMPEEQPRYSRLSAQDLNSPRRVERVVSSGYGSTDQLASPNDRLSHQLNQIQISPSNRQTSRSEQSKRIANRQYSHPGTYSRPGNSRSNDPKSDHIIADVNNNLEKPQVARKSMVNGQINRKPSSQQYSSLSQQQPLQQYQQRQPLQHSMSQPQSTYDGPDLPSYRVLYNYKPHSPDELELQQGDIVHVVEKCSDGWYVGTSGRTGLFGTFPGNYSEPI